MKRAAVRVVRGEEALDGGEAIIKPAGGFMQIVEQALVSCGEGGSGLPARDIMEDQPWQPDEEHAYEHDGDENVCHAFNPSSAARPSSRRVRLQPCHLIQDRQFLLPASAAACPGSWRQRALRPDPRDVRKSTRLNSS